MFPPVLLGSAATRDAVQPFLVPLRCVYTCVFGRFAAVHWFSIPQTASIIVGTAFVFLEAQTMPQLMRDNQIEQGRSYYSETVHKLGISGFRAAKEALIEYGDPQVQDGKGGASRRATHAAQQRFPVVGRNQHERPRPKLLGRIWRKRLSES